MAAAVADFTPRGGSLENKQSRNDGMMIDLVPTPDLVACAAKKARDDQRIIAFALGESISLEDIAKEKLKRKGVDAIVANPLQTMDANEITATIYCKDGTTFSPPPNCSKTTFANWIINHLDDICSTPLSS
jgi:phosphopantothenoylcysteine decarboxylase/phosphopantothenate--cysteine ligase